MNPSPSAADWERLGDLLTRRRVELDPRFQNRTTFAKERGLNYRLAYDVEEAKRPNFRPATLAAIASAYAVTAASVAAVLRGTGELEPAGTGASLTGAGTVTISTVPGLPVAGAQLNALENIAARIASATPEQLEWMDEMVGGIVQGDELAEHIWNTPSRHRPGEKAPLDKRLLAIISVLRDDPRRSLGDKGPASSPVPSFSPGDDVDRKIRAAALATLTQENKPDSTVLRELEALMSAWPGTGTG